MPATIASMGVSARGRRWAYRPRRRLLSGTVRQRLLLFTTVVSVAWWLLSCSTLRVARDNSPEVFRPQVVPLSIRARRPSASGFADRVWLRTLLP